MPVAALSVLKYLFLLLIFLFLIRAVRVMILEISGGPRMKTNLRRTDAVASKARSRAPERLVILIPQGKPQQYEIGDELILGRSEKCHIVLSDTYASQVHARVFRRNEGVYLEDMGSTNGTYLNRKKVTSAVDVNRGDRAKIGKTEIEFKK